MASLLAVLAAGWHLLFESKPAATPHPGPSIAVLAFEDLSPDGAYRWFAEGLSEEVLNLLAQIPELIVIARTSSFSFRGSDAGIAEIAERLRVSHVLEGSVREDDETVRITVQLVAAESDSHLWCRTYDRALKDVFGVQSDIASAVAEALKLELLDRNLRPADHVPDPEAWSLYLRARYFYDRRGPGELARTAELFRHSVERDPLLAAAWAELAAAHQVMILSGEMDRAAGLRAQREAARRALDLAPEDATVLMRAARAAGVEGDRERMWALFYRARELEPNNLLVLGAQASFAFGQPEHGVDVAESLQLHRRYARLDPMGLTSQSNLGHALLRAGHFKEAEAQFRYVRELNPANTELADEPLALAQLLAGQPDDALATARSLSPGVGRLFVEALAQFALGATTQSDAAIAALSAFDDIDSALRLAEIYSYRGDPAAALGWLDTARQRLTPATPWLSGPIEILLAAHGPFLLRHQDDSGFMARLKDVRREMLEARDAGFTQHGEPSQVPKS